MKSERFIEIFLAVLSVAIGLLGSTWRPASAETNGTGNRQPHTHHHVRQDQPLRGEDVTADLKTEPDRLRTGNPATLLFSITDREGKPVQGLSIMHDRYLHVVIAGQDFTVFAHIHPQDFGPVTPEMVETARFPVRYTFPKAGRYIIGADFAVKDRPFSRHFTVDVAGEPEMGAATRDLSRTKRFGDYEVTLSSLPVRVTAGAEVMLRYVIGMKGEPVTDLEPYLSAPMHLSILSGDLTQFIHTHGELKAPSTGHPMDHMHMTVPDKFGPDIEVHTVFPVKGLYQIFGEFQHHGKVIVTGFMVEVE